jgi:hypothetical protein
MPNAKLVVGRNEKENERLFNLAQENDYLFLPTNELAGPTALGRGQFNEDLIKISCRITCRYCDLNGVQEAEILIKRGTVPFSLGSVPLERFCNSFDGDRPYKGGDSPYLLKVSPLDEDKFTSLRI